MKTTIKLVVFYFLLQLCNHASAAYSVQSAWFPYGPQYNIQVYRLFWGTNSGEYTHTQDFGLETNLAPRPDIIRVLNVTIEVPNAGQTYYFMIRGIDSNGNEFGTSEEYPWWVQRENDARPSISAIPNRHFLINSVSNTVPFTIGDDQTPLDELEVYYTAWNPIIIPATNISLGGSGANRTITLTPITGRTGTTTVEVIVIDNNLSPKATTFIVEVSANPGITSPRLLWFKTVPLP